jgi:outer membrane protein assembly factor BamE (lipoprotein component of BamABCDE complex)
MRYFLTALLFVLCGCESKIENRGFNPESYKPDLIKVGVDDSNAVQEKMGPPSTVAPFPDKDGLKVWYYIAKKVELWGFHKPETLDQFVIIVRFNKADKVAKVEKITGETQVEPNSEKTEISGYESGVLRDVFGNFGRNLGKKSTN